MASNLEFVQFVCDQLGEQVSCRRMFGEYGLFAHGKYFACVCGNQLFFKATPGGRTLLGSALGSCQLEPPYPGAAGGPGAAVPVAGGYLPGAAEAEAQKEKGREIEGMETGSCRDLLGRCL